MTRAGVAIVLGTRPEMIKLAEIARLLGPQARVFHTGQHYDENMSSAVWQALGIPEPERVLNVGGLSRAQQVAAAVADLDEIFTEHPPAAVVVQGDTNATLAGALAANAHGIPLIHVEAGLRSFDREMPEEHNRVMVDHIADVLCAPTSVNRDNLLAESIDPRRVVVTGNTVVEAVRAQMPPADETFEILEQVGVRPDGFVVATVHRPENTDDLGSLATILSELAKIDVPVVLPLHPRTLTRVKAAGLGGLLEPLVVIDPLAPPQFLALASCSAAIVSDSGGLQEECSVLKRPLLVVRRSTERPEVLGTFAQRTLPGPQISTIVNAWVADLPVLHNRLAATPSPYGDGTASAQIAELARQYTDARDLAAA
ncbi:non-hydrolyzing UDP-N-acetylglucosamine 2-epimerase [Cellulosimicrobium sp. NPDC057862]|uniref:non-hydrolyzing UDP-N-acetylglucosamine 2-epimerase n=1 Tax=Cellulosimicrobium sp. NPDC057862 TaxID=3346266 RepID=UPI00366CE2CE